MLVIVELEMLKFSGLHRGTSFLHIYYHLALDKEYNHHIFQNYRGFPIKKAKMVLNRKETSILKTIKYRELLTGTIL